MLYSAPEGRAVSDNPDYPCSFNNQLRGNPMSLSSVVVTNEKNLLAKLRHDFPDAIQFLKMQSKRAKGDTHDVARWRVDPTTILGAQLRTLRTHADLCTFTSEHFCDGRELTLNEDGSGHVDARPTPCAWRARTPLPVN